MARAMVTTVTIRPYLVNSQKEVAVGQPGQRGDDDVQWITDQRGGAGHVVGVPQTEKFG
jgi:hypothetical protein